MNGHQEDAQASQRPVTQDLCVELRQFGNPLVTPPGADGHNLMAA